MDDRGANECDLSDWRHEPSVVAVLKAGYRGSSRCQRSMIRAWMKRVISGSDGPCDSDHSPEIPVDDHRSMNEEETAESLAYLSSHCRRLNDSWWRDPATGEPIERNKGELIALMHSELSEALEGIRKDLMDDHLPHRKMEEVELADVLVRIFDYAGGFGLDLGGAFVEKLAYNKNRADHKPENRVAGGKRF